jgi:hypothetical protein
LIGYSFFEFDIKRENFYEDGFAEHRVKYNISLTDWNKSSERPGNDWYDKAEKDKRDDYSYLNYPDSIFFMFKYLMGMVPEQGVLPQETNPHSYL